MTAILKNFLYFPRPEVALEYFGSTLAKTAPLLMCTLSILFAYKVGLFNIGASGQYAVGAGLALYLALSFHMPWYVCMIAAMIGGGILGGIAGILKAYLNVNEVIAGIMLNWISLYSVNMLLTNVKESSTTYTMALKTNSPDALIPSFGLDNLFSNNRYVTIAIPLAIIVAILVWILMSKTKLGYELKATGLNKNAAKYAGMKEKRNMILTMVIAGCLSGLGAALSKTKLGYELKATGLNKNAAKYAGMKEKRNMILTMVIAGCLSGLGAAFLYLSGIEQWSCAQTAVPAMGFNGIAAAFLGGLNPIGSIFSAFFIQHITSGGSYVDKMVYCAQISDLISEIIIYFCGFVLFFKHCMNRKAKK